MPSYEAIAQYCEERKAITQQYEEFLMHFIAGKEGLDKTVQTAFRKYRHAWKGLSEAELNTLKGEFVTHRIFREGGLIHQYIDQGALKRELSSEEYALLLERAQESCFFSFGIVRERPAENFFNMVDILGGEEYLLYSPGMEKTLTERNVRMWLNLVQFNGECMETYGVIIGFSAFEPSDIVFYASEVHHEAWFEDGAEIRAEVEKNPVPYLALLSGSDLPVTMHGDQPMVYLFSEYDEEPFETEPLREEFVVEYHKGVYRFSYKEPKDQLSGMSALYYDEKERLLIPFAMADQAYEELIDVLNGHGFGLDEEPDHRVNLSMLLQSEKLLGKKAPLRKYEALFEKEPDEQTQGQIDQLDEFMALILPDLNAGREPDFDHAVQKTGVDRETAKDFMAHIQERLRNMGRT